MTATADPQSPHSPDRSRVTKDWLPRIVLSCRNLRKSFGSNVAVDGVSFDVLSGEAFGLLGPNGAGKTTTIRMVCNILPADAGRVTIENNSLGYVPQALALLPNLTLAENLRFWAKLYGQRRSQRSNRIDWALQVVGLTDRARERVDRCSGGMQRRLNLAVALLARPRVLVLDEPTVGVDAQSRAAILETLGRLRDKGTAILYTSHYMDEISKLCDRVAVIDHGRMLVEGQPQSLLEKRPDLADLEGLYLDLTGRELRD